MSRLVSVGLICWTGVAFGDEVAWSAPAIVDYRDEAVVTYRARVAGEYLMIEATHADGWHTYAMDNVQRARERTGKEKPETELPTKITVSGGLAVEGDWYQTPPADLSQEAIHWYTWGFEGKALFVGKVEPVSDELAEITIDGQACNESRCRMVDRVRIELPASATTDEAPDLESLAVVAEETPADE